MAQIKTPAPATPVAAPQALTGILLITGGALIFSVNDMAVKHLSGAYALHQIILIRALIGMIFLAVLVARAPRGLALLRTGRPGLHLLRVGVILLSNVTYFTGLARMEIADAAAVAYVSPLAVTAMSVFVLGEKVGPRRWSAVLLGLLGVIVMLRPGAGVIQPAALLVLVSALLYATGNLLTRRMGGTESAITLSFYVQTGFILASGSMGLIVGDGHLATTDPLWQFLVRPWFWPPLADWPWLLATGISVSVGGLMVAQAYRTTEAGLIAPFEYAGMPMAIFWGVVIFGTWPDLTSWLGIALICGSGLYVMWREAQLRRKRR